MAGVEILSQGFQWQKQKKSKNLYIDLDEKGNLVSMTIEHAKEKANLSEVSFLQMANNLS